MTLKLLLEHLQQQIRELNAIKKCFVTIYSICVCVPMPTHCTIMHFGFRARQINGIECGLFFQIMPHLGRPHYVWDEYLYSVL